jgi:pyruvate dehydrogenase E1 component alpha subunit
VQRFRGHFEGDPQPYRTKASIEEAKKNDPIRKVAARLLSEGIATEDDLAAIRGRLQEEVDTAGERALSAPMPPPERLYQGVYA